MLMHSVSYRLTQLNGIPYLICNGSFSLHFIWKNIVNKEGRRNERRKGGEDGRETRAKGGWILPSALIFSSPPVPPLSLFLMFVLSLSSRCGSVAIIYTLAVALYCRQVVISSLILCAVFCITDWRPLVLWEALKLLVFTIWWQRELLFEIMYTLTTIWGQKHWMEKPLMWNFVFSNILQFSSNTQYILFFFFYWTCILFSDLC